MEGGSHALSLQEATRNSTAAWQRDLAALFRTAKDRFPDVVWELTTDDAGSEDVWGHKAIVYARAPPSFQTRYFSFRPQENRGSPLAASAVSLDIPRESRSPSPSPWRTASPAPSTIGGVTRLKTAINPALFSNELEYLYTGQGFGEAFEFLFDEQAGEVSGAEAEDLRIDKLRKDLVFMWRSRLYSDVRIALMINNPPAPTDDDDAHDRQMPVFSSHRFVLASRCQYFHTALLSWPSNKLSTDTPTLSLPSPPFTPASLHFTLGFIYTGTLVFSHRTYDLTTALALLLSANYLSIPTLHTEVQARIVSEMAHGLFHAALPFAAYEALTGGAWRAGGCTCRKCAARIPRILEFAIRPDVQDPILERGSRRALVGLFGPGWCTSEFAALPPKLHAAALKGLAKRSTPANALAILWAAEAARARLAPLVDAWTEVVKPLIDSGRNQVDRVMADQTAEVFAESDWASIVKVDGVRFEDGERVEWAMRSVVRGVSETNAGRVYQALVNVLLLPQPEQPVEDSSFPEQPLLSQTSHVRVQVEQARMDVLGWMKRGGRGRADRVAREGGLDGVEGWAIREIADHLELPVDDLLAAIPSSSTGPHSRQGTVTSSAVRKSTALLSANGRDADAHSLSIHTQQSSMRVSVLSKAIPTPRGARSVRREGTAEEEEKDEDGDESMDRPDSKLTPELGPGLFRALDKGKGRAPSFASSSSVPASPTVPTKRPPAPTRAVPPSPNGKTSPTPSSSSKYARSTTLSVNASPGPRPRSSASTRSTASTTRTGTTATQRPGSSASTRTTSTVRTTATTRGGAGLRPPPVVVSSGRASRASTSASASVTEFKTARSRQSSVSSVASKHSPARNTSRTRTTSVASDASVRTTGGSRPPMPPLDPGATVKKRPTPSIRSVASSTTSGIERETAASAARKAAAAATKARTAAASAKAKEPEVKVITLKQRTRRPSAGASSIASAAKEKENTSEVEDKSTATTASSSNPNDKEHRKTESTASTVSTASASTLRGFKRRGSGDTVSTAKDLPVPIPKPASSSSSSLKSQPVVRSTAPKRTAPPTGTLQDLSGNTPRGAMLEIGIPCIISTKRKRFKAFARYIGEVEGEAGPWVGVEVPASTADAMPDNRQWHDGSWGGVRYFEISANTESEADYGLGDDGRDRANVRRRRLEGSGTSESTTGYGTIKGVKRPGDSQLGGARGAKRIRSASPAVSDAGGEPRGLFVRPSAVLYVVDAVGADL
ncbi:hypothetical protein HMN09_00255100 [Mycena chlorophos]|uniref:CAP-Gly domain-containing protein n=1 Tax=Mycena chlorophos TaxID=658473 RepID=A0A8H6WJF7_MYCCL|nr:hypothetical protein HMN09_00255100 [Mycena chlorophos]